MATGVYVGFRANCFVGEVESLLMIIMVKVTEKCGFGVEFVGCVGAVSGTTRNRA